MTLTSENIDAYAETLARQVRPSGAILDYTRASLAILDQLVARSADSLLSGELPDAHRNLAVFYHGCYVGETLRRLHGGVWQFAENWFDSTLVLPKNGDSGGIEIRPFEKSLALLFTPADPNAPSLANSFAAYADAIADAIGRN